MERNSQGNMTSNKTNINDLIKRIQLLEIENERLRKENETLKKKSRPTNNFKENKSQVTSKNPLNKLLPIFNSKTKGCTCKGNCSGKICGCKKKNLRCNETCKCNSATCRNAEEDKENRGIDCSPKMARERAKLLSNQAENQNENTAKEALLNEKNSHQPGPSSSRDNVFDPNLENANSELNAARKLTFLSDDDTLDDRDLTAIQETEQQESANSGRQDNERIKKTVNEREKSSKNKSKNPKANVAKLTKTKVPSDSKKIYVKVKEPNKDRKLKQTSVQKQSNENEETSPEVSHVNLRTRLRNKISNDEETARHLDFELMKSTGVTSCIKSLNQPENLNQAKSSHSRNNTTDENNLSSRITRRTTSRISGLRRSFSCESIGVKPSDKQGEFSKLRSRSRESLTKNEDKTGTRQLKHSQTSENLRRPIFNVSHSFRRSKSSDVNHRQKYVLTPVEESPQVSSTVNNSNEQVDKSIKLDPMQPTYQLSRSPIPPVSLSFEQPNSSITHSPPIFSRFLSSQDVQVFSPSPEILQDLNAEEVDHEEFQSKLVKCRKCKRLFFPHRIQVHEVVCLKK